MRDFKTRQRLAKSAFRLPTQDHYFGGMTRPMTVTSLFFPSHSSGSGVSANKPPECSAGYLSPNTDALSTRSRRRCDSSGVRSTYTESKFSFKYFGVIVLRALSDVRKTWRDFDVLQTHPGIGKMSSPWARSHASAAWPTVTSFAVATSLKALTSSIFLGKFSLEYRG